MNIWEILQVSGKRKRQRRGVIPISRPERSIAPQRTGLAQLHGHAAKEGHADGILWEYASLHGRRFQRIPPPLNPSGSGWTRRQRLTGGVTGPPAYLLLPPETCKISQIFILPPNLMIQISSDSINHALPLRRACTFFQRTFLHTCLVNSNFLNSVTNFRKSQRAQN